MSDDPDYEDAVRRLKNARWGVGFFAVASPIIAVEVAILAQYLARSQALGYLLNIVLCVAVMVSVLGLMLWRCPRCGAYLYKSAYLFNPFRSQCPNCKLLLRLKPIPSADKPQGN